VTGDRNRMDLVPENPANRNSRLFARAIPLQARTSIEGEDILTAGELIFQRAVLTILRLFIYSRIASYLDGKG
jgi:hypothetical protein